MRLIDADALKAKLNPNIVPQWFYELIDNAPAIIKCSKTSDGLPLMDLRPRPQGEWKCICSLNSWQFTDEHYECDKCHYKGSKSNFCPNCGALMQKGGSE